MCQFLIMSIKSSKLVRCLVLNSSILRPLESRNIYRRSTSLDRFSISIILFGKKPQGGNISSISGCDVFPNEIKLSKTLCNRRMSADVRFYWESTAELAGGAELGFDWKLETESVELAINPIPPRVICAEQTKKYKIQIYKSSNELLWDLGYILVHLVIGLSSQ